MADGRHHGSLNDTAPNQGASPPLGHDLPGDLAALDLEQLMGLDVIVRAPSAGGSSLPGEEDLPADLMDLDLDQLMGLDISSNAPLPRSNTDTFDPLPPAPSDATALPAALSPPVPSPIPAAIVGVPDEGTVVEDVIADASGGDDGVLGLDELGANARNDDPNHQGPQGEDASLDLVGLDLETLMEIAVGGIGEIEDIALNGDASLDGGAEFDVFDLGALAPALGQPLSQFSAGLTGETTETSPIIESDDTGSGGDTTTTDPTPPTSPNNAPTAAADGATTNEDTAVTVAVLGNDSDVDGDSLSVSAVTQGANGAVVINGDNTVTYTPDANFNGADSFTYTVDDGNGGSDTATVNVTVNAVNDAPATNNVAASGAEDAASIAVTLTGGDVDGTVQSFALGTLPANGTLYTDAGLTTAAATGTDYAASGEALTLYFVPAAEWNGVTSFDFTAKDDGGASDASPATATITVTSVNDAPAAANDNAGTPVDTAVIISVLANDTDPDTGDTLSITGVTQGANGTVVDNGDGTVTYTPNLSFNGSDSFTYTVDDGNGGSDTATVNVTVGGSTINGTAGDDTLTGTAGDDTINGLAGNDILEGLAGADSLDGGTGTDTADYSASGAGVTVNLGTGTGTGGDAQGDTLTAIENVTGSAFNDSLQGDGNANTLVGGGGDDTLKGNTGDDILYGGAGNDTLQGQNDNDTLYGGDGNDTVQGNAGDDTLFGEAGIDNLTGAAGTDTLDGGAGADTLNGGGGNDILVWDSIDTVINGGSGSDTLRVDSGDADLTAFAGTIQRIEQIDLESDTGANTVTLSAQDVLDISDTDTVTVTGDAGDTVDAGTGWTDGGVAGGFHTYTQGLATLLVDTDVAVNADITA